MLIRMNYSNIVNNIPYSNVTIISVANQNFVLRTEIVIMYIKNGTANSFIYDLDFVRVALSNHQMNISNKCNLPNLSMDEIATISNDLRNLMKLLNPLIINTYNSMFP